MSKEQTALERIKDEVAKEKGYMEWSNLFGANPEIFNQVCERYARECCQSTLDDYKEKLKAEFERLKKEAPSLRDAIYLDGVLAVIDSIK